jgi:glucosamine 6-phosphate synthetase-like amidotransferase/phosphosugar isomerase protein
VRRSPVVGVLTNGGDVVADQCDDMLWISQCPEPLSSIPVATPLELFAYHMASLPGEDTDRPPNLAKTVTAD